jgi:hypothetical protein
VVANRIHRRWPRLLVLQVVAEHVETCRSIGECAVCPACRRQRSVKEDRALNMEPKKVLTGEG